MRAVWSPRGSASRGPRTRTRRSKGALEIAAWSWYANRDQSGKRANGVEENVSLMPVAAIAGIFIVAIAAWGVVRLRRGRAAIQAALERKGYEVLQMERRIVRQGPFWWTTTPAQIVFRVLVLEPNGRQ